MFKPKIATNGDKSIMPTNGTTLRMGFKIGAVKLLINGMMGLL